MPLSRRGLLASAPARLFAPAIALLLAACICLTGTIAAAGPAQKPRTLPPAAPIPRHVAPPPAENNLVINGGFERVKGEDPEGWAPSGRARPGARVRAVAIPDAPEGRRVAEISMRAGGEPSYGIDFEQDLRLDFWTTYDLSVWVRGINLVSAVDFPRGYGRQCGIFFWILGPSNVFETRAFPASASPRKDGTTGWELRTMRFTTPPRDAFPDRSPDGDDRLHLQLSVQLVGTGTIQVDDLRIAKSIAAPPPGKRTPGRLALAAPYGKPLFGMGLYWLPGGITWRQIAQEKIFNFSGGHGDRLEKSRMGLPTLVLPGHLDPACRGCDSPTASLCSACLTCPKPDWGCDQYSPDHARDHSTFLAWVDEENASPVSWGDLDYMVQSARRIHADAARLLPPGRAVYIFSSDMPGAVYFNSYGWDDLAEFHSSEAFDIVAALRRGGNPRKGAKGSVMSEYPETAINGIRHITRRMADDVTDPQGRQRKPVWMLVNGGSYRINTDPSDPDYPFAPHDAAELLAMRPSRAQLRYMLYAAILNGATGLLFYQDESDTLLTSWDPYWTQVLFPCAAELATLEKTTGFLTHAEYNEAPYRLTGNSQAVDSMLKRVADAWILAVANANPDPLEGVEFEPGAGWRVEGPVEQLTYRHDAQPARRSFASSVSGEPGEPRVALDLPGYGVALYRFHLTQSEIPERGAPDRVSVMPGERRAVAGGTTKGR